MKKVAFYTLGCKVNSYDTQAMIELFENSGYEVVDFNELADYYIVNTCTVTHFGDKKSRQMLRRAKRLNPEATIVATGCYAQVSPESLEQISEIDLIVGTKDKENIVSIIEGQNEGTIVEAFENHEAFDNLQISKSNDHTRAYIKIQDGCRQFCTYCIVPYARGPLRSKEQEVILKEVNGLIASGFNEIVLTGIHIASFGKEKGEKDALASLIRTLGENKDLKRLRLSSLEPTLITRDFLEVLKDTESFCPHFHLSLQSGSNSVLKRMNRHYTTETFRNIVELIREYFPKAYISTDIIVGFPGESDEEFNETLNFVKDIGFSKVHIFPYSPRQGTKAAAMTDQVESQLKQERVKRLTEVELEERKAFLEDNDGEITEVLFEREIRPNIYSGYSKSYIPVETYSEENLEKKIKQVKLEYIDDTKMKGELINV